MLVHILFVGFSILLGSDTYGAEKKGHVIDDDSPVRTYRSSYDVYSMSDYPYAVSTVSRAGVYRGNPDFVRSKMPTESMSKSSMAAQTASAKNERAVLEENLKKAQQEEEEQRQAIARWVAEQERLRVERERAEQERQRIEFSQLVNEYKQMGKEKQKSLHAVLKDLVRNRWFERQVAKFKDRLVSVLLGNPYTELNQDRVNEVLELVSLLRRDGFLVIYDADSSLASFIEQSVEPEFRLGVSGNPIRDKDDYFFINNPYLRFRIFQAAKNIIVSPDSITGAGLVLDSSSSQIRVFDPSRVWKWKPSEWTWDLNHKEQEYTYSKYLSDYTSYYKPISYSTSANASYVDNNHNGVKWHDGPTRAANASKVEASSVPSQAATNTVPTSIAPTNNALNPAMPTSESVSKVSKTTKGFVSKIKKFFKRRFSKQNRATQSSPPSEPKSTVQVPLDSATAANSASTTDSNSVKATTTTSASDSNSAKTPTSATDSNSAKAAASTTESSPSSLSGQTDGQSQAIPASAAAISSIEPTGQTLPAVERVESAPKVQKPAENLGIKYSIDDDLTSYGYAETLVSMMSSRSYGYQGGGRYGFGNTRYRSGIMDRAGPSGSKDAGFPKFDGTSEFQSESIPYRIQLLNAAKLYVTLSSRLRRDGESQSKVPAGAVLFGSAKGSGAYNTLVKESVEILAQEGVTIATGGSGGFMELANRTAKSLGAFSIGIPLDKSAQLSTEKYTASGYHSLTVPVPDYSYRIPLLLQDRQIILLAPGGTGTMQELATTLVMLGSGSEVFPVLVFLDADYYSKVIQWVKQDPFPRDLADRIYSVNSPEEMTEVFNKIINSPGTKLEEISAKFNSKANY